MSFGAKDTVTPPEPLIYCRRRANISRRNIVLNLTEILDGSLLVVGSQENISDLEIGNTTIRKRSFQLRGTMPSKIRLSFLAKIYVTRWFYLFVYQTFYTAWQVKRERTCHCPRMSQLLIIRSQLLTGIIITRSYHIRATYPLVWLRMLHHCNHSYDHCLPRSNVIFQENYNMVQFPRTPQ